MRAEKQLLLDDIKDMISGSKALVFASYKKFEPNSTASFRSTLSKSGGALEVVKKRVLIKAAQVAGFELDHSQLQGHIAIVIANQDPVQTTKVLYKFCQENENVLQVLGGRFEGALCSASDVEMISKLPEKDEMRAQLLGTFEAPLSQTLAVIEALLTSVVYCLDNKSNEENSSK